MSNESVNAVKEARKLQRAMRAYGQRCVDNAFAGSQEPKFRPQLRKDMQDAWNKTMAAMQEFELAVRASCAAKVIGNTDIHYAVPLMMDHLAAGGFVLMGRQFAYNMTGTEWKDLTARYIVLFPEDVFNPQEKPHV
jgi:DNA polymerase II small subunit/DNA polymerase delta subunit B